MEKARVYSYLRFSDPKQAAGSSADRQTAYAQTWAAERRMVLDSSLSLRDEGLSAYHQQHIKQGALGAFLSAVSAGRIPIGSVLIVEGLDRLSRAEPVLAQAQLAQIINAGITVVTASDGREYNRESLKVQPMDLVYSLLVMIRAHEESDTKSKRVKASIRRLCLAWQAGTYRGVIRNGKDPQWVRWNGEKFELIEDRAAAMRDAIRLFIEGHGAISVMRMLVERGHAPDTFPTTTATLYKILARPDLIGTRMLEVDGEAFELKDYYPPLITPDEHNQLLACSAQRTRRKGKGEFPGLITGIGITYCGYCGAAVTGVTSLTRKRKPDGTPHDGHRRIMCCAYSNGIACTDGKAVSVVPIEKALLSFCSDKLNIASLHSGSDPTKAARIELVQTRKDLVDLEKKLARVTEAMLADDEATPLAFVRKARELESEIATAKQRESVLEAEVARIANSPAPAAAGVWRKLAPAALKLDYDARMKVRKLFGDTFQRIVIYTHGTTPDGTTSDPIDLILTPKGGIPRLLRINRKTGQWIAQEEI